MPTAFTRRGRARPGPRRAACAEGMRILMSRCNACICVTGGRGLDGVVEEVVDALTKVLGEAL